jgi:hypothetical protein
MEKVPQYGKARSNELIVVVREEAIASASGISLYVINP